MYLTYIKYLRATNAAETNSLSRLPHHLLHFLYFFALTEASKGIAEPPLKACLDHTYGQLRKELKTLRPNAPADVAKFWSHINRCYLGGSVLAGLKRKGDAYQEPTGGGR
jgi:hypothetical protein